MLEQHYTIQQVADRLSIHHQTVRVLIRDGLIEAFRLGKRNWRISETAVSDYLGGKTKKKPPVNRPGAKPAYFKIKHFLTEPL